MVKWHVDNFDYRNDRRWFRCMQCKYIFSVKVLNTVMNNDSEGKVDYYCDKCLDGYMKMVMP